ncbi:MAG: metal-dependent hydrolase [Desulfobacteraceae bacterium]|nr:metal-dependent hydrolase [Pseudomonadota bacterium]MBU4463747.1 metal-dependent hydrolase [Pseudomonadota bacterium]MCG2754656.1 metal-dependent hydrolase [Desulfobacteraceae bacterium]
MDPITHITTGVLGAQVVCKHFNRRFIILFCIIAAWLPDIDNLVTFLGPELYLIHHRGATHSFAGGLILSMLLVAAFKLFIKPFPIIKGLIISFSIILIHIYLDLVTSYGTQIFYPFNNTRYSLDAVYIVDLFYTVSIASICFLSFLSKKHKQRFVMLGLAWLFLYPVICLGIKYAALYHVESKLQRNRISFEKVHISPELFTPLFWKVIVEDSETYKIAGFTIFNTRGTKSFIKFDKAEPYMFKKFGGCASIFNTYAWFASYPVIKTEKSGQCQLITFGDLRFYSTIGFVRELLKNNEPPFSLTARVNESRKVMEYYYYKPGGTKVIQHLE